jgi:hypothetical protein
MSFVKYQLTPALAFMAVSSPQAYELTRKVLGSWVATQDGVPKLAGLILHAIVFILLASLLMRTVSNMRHVNRGHGTSMY